MADTHEVLDPEVDEAAERASGLVRRVRHPNVPVTVNDLAALKGEAIEVLDARIQILEVARKRAIRMTSPEDWVLFKAKDDRITGYLQDAGCDRIRDITGIEVYNVTEPERIMSADGQSFMYVIRGDGRSRLTMQVVEQMEGGRMSTDDFCKDKTGIALELVVRKAARANLDGNIVRELAGLKSVPLEELIAGWEGTNKKAEHCRKGRGFGTQDERHGAAREGEPDVEPPTCKYCEPSGSVKMVYRKSDRGDFYGCPNYKSHPNQKYTVDVKKWVGEQEKKKAEQQHGSQAKQQNAAAPQQTPAPQQTQPSQQTQQQPSRGKQQQRPEPITAGDIFDREPGQEG